MSASLYNALQFLIRLGTGKVSSCAAKPLHISQGDDSLTGVIFSDDCRRYKATILVISGLSVHGIGDPRIVNLCRAMAALGFTVLLPVYRDIVNFNLRAGTADAIADSVKAFTSDERVCPAGMLSIVAPSFSGGLALLAAARSDVAGRINAVCTIGTYGSITTVLPFMLERQDMDEYGRMIILRNFIRCSLGENNELERALELAYLDSGHRRQVGELEAFLDTMAEENRHIFKGLRSDAGIRGEHWKRIVAGGGVDHILASMDVLPAVDKIKAAVSLIHGRNDTVIPCGESELLFARMRECGVPCVLSLTALISHGDTDLKLTAYREILSLIKVFSFFFKNALSRRVTGKSLTSTARYGFISWQKQN